MSEETATDVTQAPPQMLSYKREAIGPNLIAELQPLLVAHWKEIAHYLDIPLDVAWARYYQLQAAEMLRVFTIRTITGDFEPAGKLVGYAVFIVQTNAHYSGSIQAVQDVLYLDYAFRGRMHGARFINWCDAVLKQDGVQVVYHHSKLAHDFGPLLKHLGYEAVETIYGRRLDRTVSGLKGLEGGK